MILLAQSNPDNVTGWVQLILQGGVAVYMIYWFTTKHIEAQKSVADSLRENAEAQSRAMQKVATALRDNADSNLSAVLAIKSLDAQNTILMLAAEQKKKMDEATPT